MRKLLLSFILLCFYCCASYYTDEDGNIIKLNKVQSAQYHLNEDGRKISGSEFQKKWRDQSKGLARWDYVKKDSGRVAILFKPVYATKFVNYDKFMEKLQILTGKNLMIILISSWCTLTKMIFAPVSLKTIGLKRILKPGKILLPQRKI